MKQNLLGMMLAGGTFPTGGFSQSYGLETYVACQDISSADEFRGFLNVYLDCVLARCEGPYFCVAYYAAKNETFDKLPELNEELTAMKVTKESREASHRTGRAFMRIVTAIYKDDTLDSFYECEKQNGINYAIAFGAVAARMELKLDEALRDFLYSEVNTLVQAALKLVPLGNTEAQGILLDFLPRIDEAAEVAQGTALNDVDNFCPGFDIASIEHENLHTRLYMS